MQKLSFIFLAAAFIFSCSKENPDANIAPDLPAGGNERTEEPPNDNSYSITLQSAQSSISFLIAADDGDKAGVWIDLNNNQKREIGEDIRQFRTRITCTLDASKAVKIYGRVKELVCIKNQLTAIAFSKNTVLTSLACSDNLLTSLELLNNTTLKSLSCATNKITSLDLSKNTALTYLDCAFNKLTQLDLSKNALLTELNCSNNLLASLSVSDKPGLKLIYCFDNKLAILTVSNNPLLDRIYCNANHLTSLNITQTPALKYLHCQENQLRELNLSTHSELIELNCSLNNINSAKMLELINNLPSKSAMAKAYIISNDTGEANLLPPVVLFTASYKDIAKNKRWQLFRFMSDGSVAHLNP